MLKKMCNILNIKYFVADCELGYERNVILPMIEDYKKGLTPNPDILCNGIGKFPSLMRFAKEVGADYIATGHYARLRKYKGNADLLMGKDKNKDQSYFLCNVKQMYLKKTIFPLGEMTKENVRKIAKKLKFPNWNKKGSRGICYLGKIDVKDFLMKRIGIKEGVVLSEEGNVVGKHLGVMFYTIGERVKPNKGFELSKDYVNKVRGRIYVAEKRKGNVVVVAPEGSEILKRKKVFLKDFHLINPKREIIFNGLKGRIRHLGELNGGVLRKEGRRMVFEFNKDVEGVAPGQFVVLYKGEVAVAAGEIRLR